MFKIFNRNTIKSRNVYFLALLFIGFTALFTTSSSAQNPLSRGNWQMNVGVGLSDQGIPFYLGADYGIHQDITIGAELTYRAYREDWRNVFYQHSIFGISGNGNYHFNSLLGIPRNWDVYAGLNIGFYIWSSPNSYSGGRSSGLGIGGQLGGRYFFNNSIGVNLEFGGGNAFSGGKLGLTIKL